ncbi:hypothetical protein CPB86DRAFT_810223 [Serendipita vermifera]|nr:hypothetical protein CPB86DRAFT_810223 [Serendipita vermifera]
MRLNIVYVGIHHHVYCSPLCAAPYQIQGLASVRSTLRYLLLSLVASALRCYIPALRTDWGRVVLEKGHHPHTGLMVANLPNLARRAVRFGEGALNLEDLVKIVNGSDAFSPEQALDGFKYADSYAIIPRRWRLQWSPRAVQLLCTNAIFGPREHNQQ